MNETKSLLDFTADEPGMNEIPFKDEARDRLDKIVFDSGYFVSWCYDEDEDMTLTKTRVIMRGERKDVGKGKNLKTKFYLAREFWLEKFNETLVDDICCKDLNELEEILETEKGNIAFAKRLFEKGIIFDGRRYCWKFEYNGKKLILTEKVMPELEGQDK